MATASHITGKVTGPDGTGLSNVSVSAYQKAPGSSFWNLMGMSTFTNSAGEYDLGGLKAGTYRIGYSTYGGAFLREFWDNAMSVDAASDIVVGASATVSGKNAQLATASHITGKVTGPEGTGLSNVSVSAYQKAPGSSFWNSMGMSTSTNSGRRVRPRWTFGRDVSTWVRVFRRGAPIRVLGQREDPGLRH